MADNAQYEYVSSTHLEDLTCPICIQPLIDPTCTTCQHTFCRQCIMQCQEKNKQCCPICQKKLAKDQLLPAPFIIQNLLDGLLVKCIACEQTNIQRKQFEKHIEDICPKSVINCTAADVQCPWTGRSKQLALHLQSCSYNQLRPLISGLIDQNKSLQKKNEEYKTHIKQLEEENKELSNRSMLTKTHANQLEERIRIFQDSITRQNTELDHKIQSSLRQGEIRAICQNLIDVDMMIIVLKGLRVGSCTSLELQGNKITSHGISVLVSGIINNKTLVKLNLGHNPIGDDGIHLLATALSNNTSSIEKLHLIDTGLTDRGVQSLAEMLKTNTKVSSLSLFNNQISDNAVEILCDVLIHKNHTLIGLFIQQNQLITDKSVAFLAAMIEKNSSLKVIDIEQCSLTANGIKQLQKHLSLRANQQLTVKF